MLRLNFLAVLRPAVNPIETLKRGSFLYFGKIYIICHSKGITQIFHQNCKTEVVRNTTRSLGLLRQGFRHLAFF